MQTKHAFVLSVSIALSLVFGCTERDPTYCDENIPCDPGYWCNLENNTCYPIDGGIQPDGLPDLGVDAPAPDQAPPSDSTADFTADGGLLPRGTACTGDVQCATGHCVDGFCCETKCDGICRTCALAGDEGTCNLALQGQDPDQECKGAVAACDGTCDGQGACTFPDATQSCGAPKCTAGAMETFQCDGSGGCSSTSTDCGGYTCNAAGDACNTSCSGPTDCTGTFQCVGGKCVNSLPLGAVCGTNNSACASGFCADGVCCNSACPGTCMACNLTGKAGTCSAVPNGQDPDGECAGTDPACGGTCNGSGACAYAPTSKQCKSPFCSSGLLTTYNCDGSGGCNGTTTSCNGYACATATACKTSCTSTATDCTGGYQCVGGKCVVNLPNGTACEGNNLACASGHCVDGVCCNSACTSSCQACNLAGKVGTCSDVTNGTVCGTATCNVNIYTTLTCQNGTCTPSSTTCTNSLKCNGTGTACLTSCSSATDCVSKPICAAGKCMSWVTSPPGTTKTLRGIWGESAGKMWIVGDGGTTLYYANNSWTAKASGTTADLYDVWGTSWSNVWAGGTTWASNGGVIIHFGGTTWGTSYSGSFFSYGLWGANATDIWAVGGSEDGLRYSGGAWNPSTIGGKGGKNAIWGTAWNDIWAVGEGSVIVQFNGSTWTVVSPGISCYLSGIWGTAWNNIWAVGDSGVILRYNGSGWSSVTSNTTNDLYGVWGSGASDVHAVGAGGTVVHYNGTTWSTISSGTTQTLRDVWGSSATDVWIVGDNGTILHTE